jgi:hypothetical protein
LIEGKEIGHISTHRRKAGFLIATCRCLGALWFIESSSGWKEQLPQSKSY